MLQYIKYFDGNGEANQMNWNQVRQKYPAMWLVIEALRASSGENIRHIEDIAVVTSCPDGSQALQTYQALHEQFPGREFYFMHTSRLKLDIEERHWVGILGLHRSHETHPG
jgi:hypothetical protein